MEELGTTPENAHRKVKAKGGKGGGKGEDKGKGKGGDMKGGKGKSKGKGGIGEKGKGKGGAPQYGACWTCGGPHFSRDCLKGKGDVGYGAVKSLSSIQEVRTQGDDCVLGDTASKSINRNKEWYEVTVRKKARYPGRKERNYVLAIH